MRAEWFWSHMAHTHTHELVAYEILSQHLSGSSNRETGFLHTLTHSRVCCFLFSFWQMCETVMFHSHTIEGTDTRKHRNVEMYISLRYL